MNDCGTFLGKYLLCGFNFIVFVIGGLILGLGIWIAADTDSILGLVKIPQGTIIPDEVIQDILQPKYLKLAGYVIIAIGAFIFFMSFIGYCGALIENQCILTTYGLLVLIILIIEIVVGAFGFIYKADLEKGLKNKLTSTLDDYVPITNATDTTNMTIATAAWEFIMHEFHCCGIDNYKDFSEKVMGDETNVWKIPPSCCKSRNYNDTQAILECVQKPDINNSNFSTGCYGILRDKVMQKFNIVINILMGIVAVEISVIFLAFCIARMFGRRKVR